MGEIMGPEYDAAAQAASAAYKGKTEAIAAVAPRIRDLEKRVARLERLNERMARIIRHLTKTHKE